MKLKNKLLPFLGIAATASAVIPAAVACGTETFVDDPVIDDSSVTKLQQLKVNGSKATATFTGFKSDTKLDADKIVVDVTTDSVDFSGKIAGKVTNYDSSSKTFDVEIEFTSGAAEVYASSYQIFMTLGIKNGEKTNLIYATSNLYVNFEFAVNEPSTKPEAQTLQEAGLLAPFNYYVQFTGFQVTSSSWYTYAENLVVYLWYKNDTQQYVPADEDYYYTDFSIIDSSTGEATLTIYMDSPDWSADSRTYYLEIVDEVAFGLVDDIVLLSHEENVCQYVVNKPE